MAERMKVYIAGPMSGYPAYNFPAFFDAERRFASAGWEVVNPARLDTDAGFDPETDEAESGEFYMKRDLPDLIACDAIALLPGWALSGGANKELAVARMCGLRVYNAETMCELRDPAPRSVLEEAAGLINGARQASYGHPADDFTRTGRMWGAILGIDDVPAERVALCMTALKISREVNRHGRDNLVDAAGYIGTIELIEARRGA